MEEAVRRRMERTHEVIEQACERALQLGDRGVLVETRHHLPVAAGPSISVPYGFIHYQELEC